MRRVALLTLSVLLVANISADDAPRIEDLAWLTGCWSADGREPGSVEQWMQPAGGAMLGMNRVVVDGNMTGFEYMRIVETGDGSLVLIASPSNQATAEFPLKSLNHRRVTFENPDHDFPHRIIYELLDDEHLLGSIEGDSDGGVVRIEFRMTRTAC